MKDFARSLDPPGHQGQSAAITDTILDATGLCDIRQFSIQGLHLSLLPSSLPLPFWHHPKSLFNHPSTPPFSSPHVLFASNLFGYPRRPGPLLDFRPVSLCSHRGSPPEPTVQVSCPLPSHSSRLPSPGFPRFRSETGNSNRQRRRVKVRPSVLSESYLRSGYSQV